MQSGTKTGRILIIVGVVILLGYIAYLLFGNILRTNDGPKAGSLPDTIGTLVRNIFNPDTNNSTIPDQTSTTTPSIVTIPKESNILRISDEAVADYVAYPDTTTITGINPTTNTPTTTTVPIDRIIYATRDEGFLVQKTIYNRTLYTKDLTKKFIANVQNIELFKNTIAIQFFDDTTNSNRSFIGTITAKTPTVVCPYIFNRTLDTGTEGRDVEGLQLVLRIITQTPGIYDDTTKKAVMVFQKEHKLNQTGIADAKTLAIVSRICTEQQTKTQSETITYDLIGTISNTIVHSIAVSPAGTLFSLQTEPIRITGTISDSIIKTPRTLFTTGITEFVPFWTNDESLFVATKASGTTNGYLFSVDTKNGIFKTILRDIRGLSVLPSPSGDYIFYSHTENGLLQVSLFNTKTKETTTLPNIQTFAEKCGWKADSTALYCLVPGNISTQTIYPDAWYQRRVQSSDSLWILPINGTARQINDLAEAGEHDGISLSVSKSGTTLFWIDQKTGYLWMYLLPKN